MKGLCIRRAGAGTLALLLASLLFSAPRGADAVVKNGFDLTGADVPDSEILQGGPLRDGIPAIDSPMFIGAAEASHVADDQRVLGIHRHGIAKAYPIAIMNWHEVVNDRFGDEPVAVTFCPLCGTGMAFQSHIAGAARSFGVSGLLYNSDVLLYDRQTESLWSQIARRAISGPLKGTRLKMVTLSHTSWRDWRHRYPDTMVLSEETGYRRNYDRDPYRGYDSSDKLFFSVAPYGARYHPKELVIGLEIDGQERCYPFAELAKVNGRFTEIVAGRNLTIEFDAENRTGRVLDEDGVELPTVIAFWFAWSAFHPDTGVFEAP